MVPEIWLAKVNSRWARLFKQARLFGTIQYVYDDKVIHVLCKAILRIKKHFQSIDERSLDQLTNQSINHVQARDTPCITERSSGQYGFLYKKNVC